MSKPTFNFPNSDTIVAELRAEMIFAEVAIPNSDYILVDPSGGPFSTTSSETIAILKQRFPEYEFRDASDEFTIKYPYHLEGDFAITYSLP